MSDTDEEIPQNDIHFTTNLVEDGFIRMSSPVEETKHNEDSINISNTGSDIQYHAIESPTKLQLEMDQLSHELTEVFDKAPKPLPVTNFPNVGSSPISEEFNDTTEGSSSENEDDLEVLDRHNFNINESFSDEKTYACDFDGIILTENSKAVNSLSDEELVSDCERPGDEPVVMSKKLRPIMKSTRKFSEEISPNACSSTSPENSPGSMDTPDVCTGSGLTQPPPVVSKKVGFVGAGVVASKPKVRFNLDINYEKEREWNRVNRIIGDASKSQIEWTQEVEV